MGDPTLKKLFIFLLTLFTFFSSFSEDTENYLNFLNTNSVIQKKSEDTENYLNFLDANPIIQEKIIPAPKKEEDLVNVQITNSLGEEVMIGYSDCLIAFAVGQTKIFKVPRKILQDPGIEFYSKINCKTAKEFDCNFTECSILGAERLVGDLSQDSTSITLSVKSIGFDDISGRINISWPLDSLEAIEF